MEPPETPAHLFPIRAFKEAMFGTPGIDADDDENLLAEHLSPQHNRRGSDLRDLSTEEKNNNKYDAGITGAGKSETPNASPTKSILATPGTTSNRRKTVSFGDGVVDNERKQGDPVKFAKTPPKPRDDSSIQWNSGSSNGMSKPPNKLMQTLLDAREETLQGTRSAGNDDRESSGATKENNVMPQILKETDGNDTANLDDPHSQSGKFWKTEFESYRVNTNKEMKKLIHYRRAAKSYAKKKDNEASRLAEKVSEEEAKVMEMESRVSQLASTMLNEEPNVDKEHLVRELSRQTALALQHNHKFKSLCKKLERHGVVGNDLGVANSQKGDQEPGKVQEHTRPEKSNDLRKTHKSLDRASAKVDEMKREQYEFGRLQDLVQSSEKKATMLEKENSALKHTISRYKQEMNKYEEQRKGREAKLRRREAKVEARFLDCRERLKKATQQHRESEDALRKSFNEEHGRMQDKIDQLRFRIAAIMENFPGSRLLLNQLSRTPP